MKTKMSLCCLLIAAGCAHSGGTNPHEGAASETAPDAGAAAMAQLVPLSGSGVSGTLRLTQLAEGGVKIEGKIFGLKAEGMHGFHVHEHGDCSAADGSSAGGHFNPTHKGHGDPAVADSHVGDLGNVMADGSGTAEVFMVKKEATLRHGDTALVGRGLIVHKLRDDLKTQPTGGSGDRLACAVIKAM